MRFAFLIRAALMAERPHKVARLWEECVRAGHEAVHVDFADIRVTVGPDGVHVWWHGVALAGFDQIYWAHEWEDAEAFVAMQALEDAGLPLFMSPRMPMGDKVTQALLLGRSGVPIPRTWIGTLAGGLPGVPYPAVCKGRYGARGEMVRWVEAAADVPHVVKSMGVSENEPFVLQEPIMPLGQDVRAFVIGGNVVAAVGRKAVDGDFRANVSLGAHVEPTILTPLEHDVVRLAHSVFGTPVSGVDFIRSDSGPVVLEVNMWPGLKGIEAATGGNVAALIVDYMVARASSRV